MRLILYARKSSEDDERQIQSIPDQISVLERMASQEQLEIVLRIEEAKSAKAPGMRPEFARMIEIIQGGEADGILCWSTNRLFRNPSDYGTVAWLLQTEVIQLIKTVEREYRPGDNVVMMAVDAAVATQYVLDLSKNVKRGLSEKVFRGWWPNLAPPGYLNVTEHHDELRVNVVRPDPKRFPALQVAWSKMATGAYTVPQVLDSINAKGYQSRATKKMPPRPLSRSTLYKMFGNPFYMGHFRYNGQLVRGNHEPMVTEADFALVQQIIRKRATYELARNELAFSGLMRCAKCGCVVTAERRQKRQRMYVYYHCSGSKGCPKRGVREEVVEQAVVNLLLRYAHYTPEMLALIEETIRRFLQEAHLDERVVLTDLRRNVADLKAKLTGLIDMRAANEISARQFKDRQTALQQTIERLESQIRRQESADDHLQKTFANAQAFVDKAYREYLVAPTRRKRLIAMMGTINNVLDNGQVQLTIHPLLRFLATFEPPKTSNNRKEKASQIHLRPAWLREWARLRKQILSDELSFPEWPGSFEMGKAA